MTIVPKRSAVTRPGPQDADVNVDADTRGLPSIEPHRPKPYVSVAELAELTPFSELAIRTMMARGILKKDLHYFDVGRRRVFKWQAIVDFIEGKSVEDVGEGRIPLRGGGYLGEP